MTPEHQDLIDVIVNYLSREKYHGFSSLLSPDLIDSLSYGLGEDIFRAKIQWDEEGNEYALGAESGYEEALHKFDTFKSELRDFIYDYDL